MYQCMIQVNASTSLCFLKAEEPSLEPLFTRGYPQFPSPHPRAGSAMPADVYDLCGSFNPVVAFVHRPELEPVRHGYKIQIQGGTRDANFTKL